MPIGRSLLRAIVGAAGGVLGLRLGGRVSAPVGPVQLEARADLARDGGVVVDLAPLGTARIGAMRGPLTITARATAVDLDRAQDLVAVDTPATAQPGQSGQSGRARLDATLQTARADLRTLGRKLAWRASGAALGGAAGAAAVTLRRPSDIAGATAAAAGLLAATAATAAVTARPDTWREPQLDGLLAKAPVLLGDLRTAPERIGLYRDQLAELIATGTAVYRRVATLPEPPPSDAVRVLHISDLHLSPFAYPLAQALVDSYRVDAVVDTGDLVDWGTPLERSYAEQVAKLGVPYLFVKGNHDSDGIAEAVAEQPNAITLRAGDAPVEVAGLRFAGMADPRFTPDKSTGDDHAEHRVSAAAAAFAASLAGAQVDVALAHDPAVGRAVAGTVPLVLAGHTHKRGVHRFGDTTVLIQGSTGGSGLRAVQEQPPTPVALSVLYFDRETRRLHSLDEVTLGGLGSVSIDVHRRRAEDLLT